MRKHEVSYGGMGYFAALAITLFLAAFVRITVTNGGVQMVIYFPIYKIIFPKGEQQKNQPAHKRAWNRSVPCSIPLYAWDKIRSEPWYTTPQNSTKAR